MSGYRAPIEDMLFATNRLAQYESVAAQTQAAEATPELLAAVLEQAAKLAGEVLAPINRSGDEQGVQVVDRQVRAAAGFREAYAQFRTGGWMSLQAPAQYGGQGLPQLLATPVMEMWKSANLAFSLCPMLTLGAIDAIAHHGSEDLRRTYLPRMVAGDWTGTMNLTEPQAGSDVGAVAARAVADGDRYRISGQKIFITWGDHDMAENIVHLVLARLPDAPEGTRGLSLFLVPKFLPGADGRPGARNDVYPASVEHKLGIHASPTCVMRYGDDGGAIGWIVGEPNRGMQCMFTMMNQARLAVGLEGVGIAERAYQQAREYARQRIQGTVAGSAAKVAIIAHPDVRRMLLSMRACVEAMRALAYVAAADVDRAARGADASARARAAARVALLTPIVKGWCTELAQEVVSLGVQIHGGMGFIEDTGAAQHLRDARITAIYEGTNGIQALDLVGRKIMGDGGRALMALLDEMNSTAAALEAHPLGALVPIRDGFARALRALTQASSWLREHFADDPHVVGSIAYDFMMLAGTVCGGWQMARAALAVADTPDGAFERGKLATASFYATHILPRAGAHGRAVQSGTGAIMAMPEDWF
ncbi:MAG: acyl-CoA dehydrogenase [Gammaproteobacteria bacterium]